MTADVHPADESPFRILVVDDEESIRQLLRTFLGSRGYDVVAASGGRCALELVRSQVFHLVLLDLNMPDLNGHEVLRQIRLIDRSLSVVIMTGFATISAAVATMKGGAEDFLIKPLSLEDLLAHVERVREHRRSLEDCERLLEQEAAGRQEGCIVTRNKRMLGVLALVAKVAPLRSTVLIQGESGTGKELIARALHARSPRAHKPFVAINCGAIPVHLLESELFGHERGAFTGAEARRNGYFQAAAGGTLFLDEISEMGADLQVKLLRVLQERCFRRVGGTEQIAADVRVVAATNRNLKDEVAAGRFRSDLYYRINVVRMTVPPLRDRPEDIPLLSYHFLKHCAREFGKQVTGIHPAVLEQFMQNRWEGNVRELENVVERAVAVSEGSELELRDLPEEINAGAGIVRRMQGLKPFRQAKESFEAEYFSFAIEEAGGNVSLAARLTDMPRQNLYGKLEKYGIEAASYR